MLVTDIKFVSEGEPKETYLPAEEKIISGAPEQNLWNNYSSGDDKFHVGIWDSKAGKWKVSYTEHEYCLILEGDSIIHDQDGTTLHVKAGDQFVIPAGFSGDWEVPSYCKKTYVIYEA
jgi:uncharacterized cupin superfamily protein